MREPHTLHRRLAHHPDPAVFVDLLRRSTAEPLTRTSLLTS